MFELVQKNWLKFVDEARRADLGPAPYVTREFEEFLGCGILAKGFVRLKCENCDENKFVPFSCKRRGFCPSCCGRRMNEGAAFFVDNVFPHVPVRQWVLSFPMPVRFWMARNPHLITHALQIFHRAMKSHYRQAAKKIGVVGEIHTGAVTVVQRFGSALNLNIHFHALLLDGVFVIERDLGDGVTTPKFIETPKPAQEEVLALMQTIQERMLRLFRRRGLVSEFESEAPAEGSQDQASIEAMCQGASVQYRLALGAMPGRRVRRIGSLGFIGEQPMADGELSAVIAGYSLHANTYVHKNNRTELERLCRYVLRPPVSEERIEIRGTSAVYKLKSQWNDGTSSILLSGTEFIEKLVAIIPQPRIHLTRFHGVLAPHSKIREKVVPAKASAAHEPEPELSNAQKPLRAHRLGWSELLKRVFNVDLTRCPSCGGQIKFIAAITNADAIGKILKHLGLSITPPQFEPP